MARSYHFPSQTTAEAVLDALTDVGWDIVADVSPEMVEAAIQALADDGQIDALAAADWIIEVYGL
jgi:hypothetical protein